MVRPGRGTEGAGAEMSTTYSPAQIFNARLCGSTTCGVEPCVDACEHTPSLSTPHLSTLLFLPSGVDAVLVGNDFPELGTDLVTALSCDRIKWSGKVGKDAARQGRRGKGRGSVKRPRCHGKQPQMEGHAEEVLLGEDNLIVGEKTHFESDIFCGCGRELHMAQEGKELPNHHPGEQ